MSKRMNRRSGMTLIEVMIALVILTGALLGMGKFITSFSHATSDGALSSVASDLVLDRLETIKGSTAYASLDAYAVTESAITGFTGYKRVTQVTRTLECDAGLQGDHGDRLESRAQHAGEEIHHHRRLLRMSAMRTTRFSRREGVTLIEMMIAIVLFVLVFGLAVPFFRYQARSVSASAGRLDALQNARYAQSAIDRDLRISGIGICRRSQ